MMDICDYCAWRSAGCHSAYFHPTGKQECADYKSLLNKTQGQRQVTATQDYGAKMGGKEQANETH